MKLARQAAPNAVRRLIELMESKDERVATVACNSILDRAFGKPKEYALPAEDSLDDLSDEELKRLVVERLVAGGISEEIARAYADRSLKPRLASTVDAHERVRSNGSSRLRG